MTNLLDHYKLLGVSIGAGIADVTSSYKRLCRIYHPDLNNDPESEELMKRINIAYTVIRDRLKREAAFRERQSYSWAARRAGAGAEARGYSTSARKTEAEEEKEAFSTLHGYFAAIGGRDYAAAYNYLCSYDRRQISRESFINWRKSVARLYPMREFKIAGGQPGVTVTLGDGRTLLARKFRVTITEQNASDERLQTGDIEKMVVLEGGEWKVFLGYKGVVELTRGFEQRFEAGRKRDIAKRWDEYAAGLCPEYNMLSLIGLRKALSREMYRQRRFGGVLTLAAMSVRVAGPAEQRGHDRHGGDGAHDGRNEQDGQGSHDTHDAQNVHDGHDELLLSAARTIAGSLRETDVPAYIGDGIFAIVYVELKKKNAGEILERLAGKIRAGALPQLGSGAVVECMFEHRSIAPSADAGLMDAFLENFRKKTEKA